MLPSFSYQGSINRKITVQARQGRNTSPILNITFLINLDYLLSETDGRSGSFPKTDNLSKTLLNDYYVMICNSGRSYHPAHFLQLTYTEHLILPSSYRNLQLLFRVSYFMRLEFYDKNWVWVFLFCFVWFGTRV
jgi:hypothetical protein